MKITIFFNLLLISQIVLGQQLDVLTYNIRYDNPKDSINGWDQRKDFLISQLNFYAPDVFGTQEGLIHQLKDIENGLDDYAFTGVGRDQGDDKGEFCAIFYNKDRLELLENNTFWLSTTPEKPSKGWDAAIKRICTYGKFKSKENGKEFFVFNTHFDHVGTKAREESAALILKQIKARNTEQLPAILMGDFNLETASVGVQLILEELQDAHIAAGKNVHGPEGTFNGFYFTQPVTHRIDFIFTDTHNFEVIKSAILSDSKDCKYPSDHLPVYTRLYVR
ncbi:endonuclease/exonuclease/phosphatase family protein [Flagellimonas sp. HMM57]|nr:endonuclease/exonuclease/phosphatase family protein [Flagellimonas sp. HMM57]UII77953.1 endonuclease/exonuclease/phosphatase family protein [Flagellimonas sp. HMM57]